MSNWLKHLLLWVIGFPILLMLLSMIYTWLLERPIEFDNFLPTFLGWVTGGFFAAWLSYYMSEARKEKDEQQKHNQQ